MSLLRKSSLTICDMNPRSVWDLTDDKQTVKHQNIEAHKLYQQHCYFVPFFLPKGCEAHATGNNNISLLAQVADEQGQGTSSGSGIPFPMRFFHLGNSTHKTPTSR